MSRTQIHTQEPSRRLIRPVHVVAPAILSPTRQERYMDSLCPEASAQVTVGIRIYKELLRRHIPAAVPFYPVGISDVTNREEPIALGMRSPEQTLLGVWGIDGPAMTRVPIGTRQPKLIYQRISASMSPVQAKK